jgi:hypothetical protein
MCFDPFGDVPVAAAAVKSHETTGGGGSSSAKGTGAPAETGDEQFGGPVEIVEEGEDSDDNAPPASVYSSSEEDQGAESDADSDGSLDRIASIKCDLREVINSTGRN